MIIHYPESEKHRWKLAARMAKAGVTSMRPTLCGTIAFTEQVPAKKCGCCGDASRVTCPQCLARLAEEVEGEVRGG